MIPSIEDLAVEWLSRHELVHLHSLRNQWGQAHVNADLTSLSWLAIPPYSGGYHTGVLRVDGRVVAAERFRWAPWGVEREGRSGEVVIRTDTRLGYEDTTVLWSTELRNTGSEAARVVVEHELLAPVAHSEVDWGWTYGTPWNAGHCHDFFTTERIRAEVLADRPRQVQLLGDDQRWLRLGSPRLPGIQRDEDTEPMLLTAELPDHSTPDSGRVRAPAAAATVHVVAVTPHGGRARVFADGWRLSAPDDEHRVGRVALQADTTVAVDVTLGRGHPTGILLTHGNHPDSLQLGVGAGRVWLAIGGERVSATEPLGTGRHRLEARVTETGATLSVDGTEVARTAPWWGDQRWHAVVSGDLVTITDTRSPATSTYAVRDAAELTVRHGESRAAARWTIELAPGETRTLGVVLAIGGDARSAAADFDVRHAAVADRWRALWANAFVPGNPDHSGYLPTFRSPDPGLARTYYLGALLAVYLRNTGVSDIRPVFLTGGPRLGPTTTFYWDISEWARTAAMLEPVGLRAWLLAALRQPYDRSHSFDTRNLLPVGNNYASNLHALFRLTQAYIGVTADLAVLGERAGDRTVLAHLRAMANRPRTGRHGLVDFGGDAWELLECVPNYRHAVVSFNASQVGVLRSFAALLRMLGHDDEAATAEQDAATLATAVLGQYAGGGRWRIAHPDGDEIIGHCLDFGLVAAELADDLDDDTRADMVAFVRDHLLDGDWLRALAPDDPVAPRSDRPDHGAAGAFAAWPGVTAYGLARLGRPDLAAAFLARLPASRSGALWGQAVEAIGGGRFRVAERGVANRDSNAAVACTEAVIAGLFDITAGFGRIGAGTLHCPFGTLQNVRAAGFDLPAPGLGAARRKGDLGATA
ncbi:hypothetical protein [Actinophytocola oryzae]|uniref:Alpha-L-rhamnosidase six-hairpin glycosidase domain-containing protein n=1 Tax=Actinophytocola oryzae TaxID=502181 RepID=A0A4R7W739_9PSEU|nr:hypothetical protein [Actinophytocola oryzae]TDV57859.1 hypothetical protein CLV71_101733 [Actinophytocola oryzae]